MLEFDPPEIKDEMISVKIVIEDHNCEIEEWYPIDDPDFDPSEFDDEVISYSTVLCLWVPQADDSPELTIKDLIDLSKELKNANLKNNTSYISNETWISLFGDHVLTI